MTESLDPVNALVADLAEAAAMPPESAYRLRLATEELFVNIVRHGYEPRRERGQVVVEGGLDGDRAWIRLTDTAPAFNPFGAPAPAGLDRPLHDREPGSLGLYLTRNAVDAASYEYVDGANRTTVVIRRGAGTGGGRECDDRDDTDSQRG
ncbi:ATP-binding protein [Actinoplanes sp. RD1]|uniref:ATP-binding protein n=1 Tax=Actinoplanes sp. RD1 TaxID=3064538 RepID=UPI0027427D9C|nr:ATP-binding protein [Actinoplanes sp. RD1]